jgi:transcriptional regulator with XRE-family HTH domain
MQRMRDTRHRRGLSLSALEELTGIGASVLSRYESGKIVPSVEKGRLVARALGVSLDFLVGDEQHVPNAATGEPACALPPINDQAPLAVSGKSSASGA